MLNGGDVTEARQAAEDLAAARDGALMASKAKSEFLSTMSHEIRTPMNGVIGLTELLLETDLDSEQLELASGVKVSAENLLVIINDILDFSKIEAGKLDLEEVALDVAGVADDVGRILAGTAHGKGIELLIDVHPDVPAGAARRRGPDPAGAAQPRRPTRSSSPPRARWSSGSRCSHENAERVALRFDVVDTGIGIAAEDQERLFRAFAQADSSTTRRFGGTGLGLAICRQLVELMGGTLGLVSAPGEGSTFWFELSLRRAESAPSAETRQRPREPRRASGRWSSTTTPPTAGSCASSCSSWGSRPSRPPTATRRSSAPAAAAATAGRSTSACRPEHAGHGRHRAGAGPEGRPVDRADDAVPAQLVGRPPRGGRVPPQRLRRQPDQAGPLLGALRLPDHRVSTPSAPRRRPTSRRPTDAEDAGGARA